MAYEPHLHKRQSMRLPGHDYTRIGSYFITICAHGRQCLFGEMVGGAVRLNDAGRIAHEEWFRAAALRQYVRLHADEFVVMPNHIHGIIRIVDDGGTAHDRRGTAPRAPTADDGNARVTAERFGQPVSGSVPTIVRAFKSASTGRINAMRGTPGAPVWQRNYFERIVRDDEALQRTRHYILNNSARWASDRMNPEYRRPRS